MAAGWPPKGQTGVLEPVSVGAVMQDLCICACGVDPRPVGRDPPLLRALARCREWALRTSEFEGGSKVEAVEAVGAQQRT